MVGSASAVFTEEVGCELAFEEQAGVLICCFYIFLFLTSRDERKGILSRNNPVSKGPEARSCEHRDSSG